MDENYSSEQTPKPESVISPTAADTIPDGPAGEPMPPVPSEDKHSGYPPVPKAKKSKKGLIILIVLLLAAAGAAYYWFMVRKDSKTSTSTTAAVTKKDVALIRYGTGEGTMNEFYPTLHNDETTDFMNDQVFEGLVGFEDKTKIVPVLADSWTNPDNSTWVFSLKPGVKFHNGDTFTAKDVVYSWQQIAKNDEFTDIVTAGIKDVVVVDDTHVKIMTDGVNPVLLNQLTGLKIIDSKAAGKADPQYGTGPYQVKTGTTPDESNIDLAAFDNYHGGHVYTREAQIKVYHDDADKEGSGEVSMLADVKAGKLDIIGFISGDNLAAAKKQNYQLFPVDDVSVYGVTLNTLMKNSPLANLKVRKAMYQAIDIPAFLKAIGRNGTSASQFVPSYIPGYNSEVTRPKLDVVAAKQALKDAGYPNGFTFTLTAYTASQDAVTELQRQLKEIGVIVKPDVKSDVSQLQTGLNKGTFESVYVAQGSSYGDSSDVFAQTVQTAYYQNAKIDDLLKQASSTLDAAKRLDYLKQVSKIGMDDVAELPMYINQPNWVVTKPFVMTQDMLSADIGVYFYKVHTTN